MEILLHNGGGYRTKLMERDRAQRFAACLRANPTFGNAAVCLSDRAQSERRFFVSYHPANPERIQDILDRKEGERAERAAAEGQSYTFVLDDSHRFLWCLSASGEVYEVTERTCTCPDFVYRANPAGISCKHCLALQAGVGNYHGWVPAGEVLTRTPVSAAQRRNDWPAD